MLIVRTSTVVLKKNDNTHRTGHMPRRAEPLNDTSAVPGKPSGSGLPRSRNNARRRDIMVLRASVSPSCGAIHDGLGSRAEGAPHPSRRQNGLHMHAIHPSLLLALALGGPADAAATPTLRDGDLIFQTSRSAQSLAVQRATGSRYSHMGIVFVHHGRPMVLEAAASVRYTPLAPWVARGINGHYVVKRLRDADVVLTPTVLARMRTEAQALLGKPYDLRFEWSDQRIYCSELVWKIYERGVGLRIGEPEPIRSFQLADPAVQAKVLERYGRQVPLDELAISPVAMAESLRLTTVATH